MNTEKPPREWRLDAIRGLLLVIMAGVHVPTPVSSWLQEPLGFMSEAEGFIFLSACLAGYAYGRTYSQGGWDAMSRRVWKRTRKIYYIHLAVLVPLALIAWLLASRLAPLANHFHDFLVHPIGALALMPLLLHQPPLFDILPLYIIFLGVTPWLLAIGRRRGWGAVVAWSALPWIVVQVLNFGFHFTGEPGRWLPLRWGAFNLPAWQFVWVTGLALGETALRRQPLPTQWRPAVGIVSGAIVLAGLLARHGFITLNPDWFMAMDKWTLGPLRLLNFAAWVGLLLAWQPRLPALPLAPLALVGRHSLAVFAFHLPLVVIASTLVQCVPLPEAMQVAVGFSVMAMLFPWAAWLERGKSRPSPPAAAASIPSRRMPIRLRGGLAASSMESPVRPIFSKMRASAGIARI